MTYYFKLPHDLYYWGQDRGGNLTPLIGQLFHKVLGLSAVTSISLSNHLVLIAGYIGLSSLFKKIYTKALFAIVWFFPPINFIELTRYAIGIQYSLIGLSVFLITKINFHRKRKLSNHLILIVIVVIMTASVWVSDLAIVSISLIVIILTGFHFIRTKEITIKRTLIYYTFFGALVCFWFIRYAKGSATEAITDYMKFNNWDTFLQGLVILKDRMIEIYNFQSIEIFYSLYAWFILGITLFMLISILNKNVHVPSNTQPWLIFFLLDFIIVFGVILLSKWVYLNSMGHWYFVASYISFSMVLLILFDNLKLSLSSYRIVAVILSLTILVGSLSTIHYLKFVRPKTLRSRIAVRSEFLNLGEIGIIGEYWNSYITACPDPSRIKATPHDKSTIRNPQLVDAVFSQENLYIIKDMWMDSFPDTLNQFGHVLVKEGNPFRIGDCNVNKYIIIE